MDKLSMCRICLVEDVTMRSLVNTKLQDIYEKLTAMSFQSEDSRPLQVCYMCYGRLQSCHRLHLNCIKSEEYLNKMLANNQLKPKLLVDMNTLKIVHPLVQLHFVPGNVEVTHDEDQGCHNTEPVDMKGVLVKEEDIEDVKEEYIDDEFSEKYTAVTDIVKVEHVTKEDNDVSNYGTFVIQETYSLTSKCDETNDQDIKAGTSVVKKAKLSKESVKLQNEISKKPETEVKCENSITNKHNKQIEDAHIKEGKRGKKSGVHTENPFKCDICGKGFVRTQHLEHHIYVHTGEKPFKCDICKKGFKVKQHLVQHIRIHTGEKPYKCDICEKRFNQKHTLNYHRRLHTGERPYKCDVCEKSFNQNDRLIQHNHIHTGEKPYKCDVCEKCFRRRQELTLHNHTHTGGKRYKCNVCKKAFYRKQHLKLHCRAHTGEKPYQCHVCEKAFARKDTLKGHARLHTGEKPYKCEVCEESFTLKSNFIRHTRVHHRL